MVFVEHARTTLVGWVALLWVPRVVPAHPDGREGAGADLAAHSEPLDREELILRAAAAIRARLSPPRAEILFRAHVTEPIPGSRVIPPRGRRIPASQPEREAPLRDPGGASSFRSQLPSPSVAAPFWAVLGVPKAAPTPPVRSTDPFCQLWHHTFCDRYQIRPSEGCRVWKSKSAIR